MTLHMTEADVAAHRAKHPDLNWKDEAGAKPGPKTVSKRGPPSHEPTDVLLWGIKAGGLPEPEPEYFFAKDHGRDYRFDFAWPDRMLALECDGEVHRIKSRFRSDMVKFRWAEVLGWHVVHCRPVDLLVGDALNLIGAMLRGNREQQIEVLRSWGSEK